ncbi:MAG: response regulator [Bryobacterales bacterium]|nr:response regulator [Bryobacterales bacterium]
MSVKTILCVDDSPTQLRVLTDALSGRGYRIVTATDGEEALQKIAETSPDLVLLDVVLPKKNGFQICRQIKTTGQTKGIKVMLVSSKDQASDRFWGMRQGADEYITKPFDPETLADRVARQLTWEGA